MEAQEYKYKKETPDIRLRAYKKQAMNSYEYFKPNYDRFHEFNRFVFESSITDAERYVLQTLGKPEIEFNTSEAYISRLCGEFANNEPSFIVKADDGIQTNSGVIDFVGNHLRHILYQANRNGFSYLTYQDTTGGGFGAYKVVTEYAHPKSFYQVIKLVRCFHPCLTGWDPLATLPHKGDGQYCFELFPMLAEDAKKKFPKINLNELNFVRQNVNGFNWCYSNNKENILLVCDFYKKQTKKVKLLELSSGHIGTDKEYQALLQRWQMMSYFQPPPTIIRSRWTELEMVTRCRFIDNQILEEEDTIFPELPMIFVDGNSRILRQGTSGNYYQMTRPFLYNNIGAQRLKNFAGQTLANELENLVQHKFKVAKESLPDEQDYLDAYSDPQKANTLVYNHLYKNDPNVMLPPPQEIVRPPIPPEISNTFVMCDSLMQNITGTFDAALGINDNQLSGEAIVQGAMQANKAASMQVINFMHSLTQAANLIVKIMPKIYIEKDRKIPIMKQDGKGEFAEINQPNGIYTNWDENSYQVKAEAGPSFGVQKARALATLTALSRNNQMFQEFLNAKGLPIIIDNLEIKGQEQLKEKAQEFVQEMEQQKAMQAQMAQQQMQNNPLVMKAKIEQMKVMQEAKQSEIDSQIKIEELEIAKQEADIEAIKVMAEIKNKNVEAAVSMEKSSAEKARAHADLLMKAWSELHKQQKEKAEFQHRVKMDMGTEETMH